MPADKLQAKKDEIRHLRDVCKYLIKFKLMPEDSQEYAELTRVIQENNWDKAKK